MRLADINKVARDRSIDHNGNETQRPCQLFSNKKELLNQRMFCINGRLRPRALALIFSLLLSPWPNLFARSRNLYSISPTIINDIICLSVPPECPVLFREIRKTKNQKTKKPGNLKISIWKFQEIKNSGKFKIPQI